MYFRVRPNSFVILIFIKPILKWAITLKSIPSPQTKSFPFPSSLVLLVKFWNFVLKSLTPSLWVSPFFLQYYCFPGQHLLRPLTRLLLFSHKGLCPPPASPICCFAFKAWVCPPPCHLWCVWQPWAGSSLCPRSPWALLWPCCLPPTVGIPFQLPDVLSLCGFCIPAPFS